MHQNRDFEAAQSLVLLVLLHINWHSANGLLYSRLPSKPLFQSAERVWTAKKQKGMALHSTPPPPPPLSLSPSHALNSAAIVPLKQRQLLTCGRWRQIETNRGGRTEEWGEGGGGGALGEIPPPPPFKAESGEHMDRGPTCNVVTKILTHGLPHLQLLLLPGRVDSTRQRPLHAGPVVSWYPLNVRCSFLRHCQQNPAVKGTLLVQVTGNLCSCKERTGTALPLSNQTLQDAQVGHANLK